jgi:hypothetical protein
MIAKSALTILSGALPGLLVVFLVWPAAIRSHLLAKTFIGLLIGTGLSACLFFWWSLAVGPDQTAFVAVELAAALLMAVLILRTKAWKDEQPILAASAPHPRRLAFLLGGLLVILLLITLGVWASAFWKDAFMRPHGTFDAYAIWNLRARFIFRDPAQWQNAFSADLNWKTHPDYPLLTTANVARSWFLLGVESTRVPIVLAGLFAVCALGTLSSALALLRGPSSAALAGLALLGAPWFPFFAGTQNAAIPLAAYYLAAAVLLAFHARTQQPRFLGLAGLAVGLAAWTKNEGLLFLVVVSALLVWTQRRRFRQSLMPYAAGLLIPLVTLLTFKLALAPPNDILAGLEVAALIQKVLDPARYAAIGRFFGALFLHLGEWNAAIFPLLLAYLALFWRRPSQQSPGSGQLATITGLVFLGYCGIYLITPHPIDWHLRYSADRLLFHLFPTSILVIFLAAESPTIFLPTSSFDAAGASTPDGPPG